LDPVSINGTGYRFIMTVQSISEGRVSELEQWNSPGSLGGLLQPLSVTVYWDYDEASPRMSKRTAIDSYLMKRGGGQS